MITLIKKETGQRTLKITRNGETIKLNTGEKTELRIFNGAIRQTQVISTGGAGRRDWIFGIPFAVPSSGELYLFSGFTSLLSAPVVVPTRSDINAISIATDKADSTKAYQVEILVDNIVTATLTLLAGQQKASAIVTSSPVLAGQEISAKLRRISGPSQKSEFRRANVAIELIEIT